LTERFQFKEATFIRRISSRGDRVYSKMLAYPVDYEEIVDNANMMKGKVLSYWCVNLSCLTMNCERK
jgi:hypothetical protein